MKIVHHKDDISAAAFGVTMIEEILRVVAE
jgi:hypothetical protein